MREPIFLRKKREPETFLVKRFQKYSARRRQVVISRVEGAIKGMSERTMIDFRQSRKLVRKLSAESFDRASFKIELREFEEGFKKTKHQFNQFVSLSKEYFSDFDPTRHQGNRSLNPIEAKTHMQFRRIDAIEHTIDGIKRDLRRTT